MLYYYYYISKSLYCKNKTKKKKMEQKIFIRIVPSLCFECFLGRFYIIIFNFRFNVINIYRPVGKPVYKYT